MSRAVAKKKDIGLKVASILLEYAELTAFPESGTASYPADRMSLMCIKAACCQQHRMARGRCVENNLLENTMSGFSLLSTLHKFRASLIPTSSTYVDYIFFDLSMAITSYCQERRRQHAGYEDNYSLFAHLQPSPVLPPSRHLPPT